MISHYLASKEKISRSKQSETDKAYCILCAYSSGSQTFMICGPLPKILNICGPLLIHTNTYIFEFYDITGGRAIH